MAIENAGSSRRPSSAPRPRACSRRSATASFLARPQRARPALERGRRAHHRASRGRRARPPGARRDSRLDARGTVARQAGESTRARDRPARARRPRALALDLRRAATRTARSTRSATSRRSARSSRCARTSSRRCRTSCARRSPRSTAPRSRCAATTSSSSASCATRCSSVIVEESERLVGDRQRPAAREPARLRQAARSTSRRCDPLEIAQLEIERRGRICPRTSSSCSTRRSAAAGRRRAGSSCARCSSNLRRQRGQVLARRRPRRRVALDRARPARPVRGHRRRASASRRPSRRAIFEKFYRLDPDMTGGIGGTGLGLYICRELVRRVNGRIWLESKSGEGSTFFVELPQDRAAPAGRLAQAPAHRRQHRLTPGRASGRVVPMPENHFGERVAARYDESRPRCSSRRSVEPVVDFLAGAGRGRRGARARHRHGPHRAAAGASAASACTASTSRTRWSRGCGRSRAARRSG